MPSAAAPTPAGARFYLRPTVLSTAIDLLAIEKIKEWDGDELLKWVRDNRPKALKGDKLEKFKAADIDGATFLKFAGKMEFFLEKCNLPSGTSVRLADLASEMAATAGKSTNHAPLCSL